MAGLLSVLRWEVIAEARPTGTTIIPETGVWRNGDLQSCCITVSGADRWSLRACAQGVCLLTYAPWT